MYGYASSTIYYWAAESILTVAMVVGLLLGLLLKRRWVAFVFPVGRLLIRGIALVFQPSDTCYSLSLDKTALLLFLSICCIVMYRYPSFGYITALLSVWSLSVLWEETYSGIETYFTFLGELTFLGVECVATVAVYALLTLIGFLLGEGRVFLLSKKI